VHTPQDHPDFIGWHCQPWPRDEVRRGLPTLRDSIGVSRPLTYNEFHDLLEETGLYYEAKALFDVETDPDLYSEFEQDWHELGESAVLPWLHDFGFRWIWVSTNAPLKMFGSYCYAVFLPEEAIVLRVKGDDKDPSWGTIYDSNIAVPQVIPVESEEHYIWGNPRRSRWR